MEALFYVKYFVAFLLVVMSFGLTFQLIKRIADFLIALLMIGAAAVVCFSIYNGAISSWSEIVGVSTLLGIAACLICVPLIPLSSEHLKQAKNAPARTETTIADHTD